MSSPYQSDPYGGGYGQVNQGENPYAKPSSGSGQEKKLNLMFF